TPLAMRSSRYVQRLPGDLEREAPSAADAGGFGDRAGQRGGAGHLQHARRHRERLLRDHSERGRALGARALPTARIRDAFRRARAMIVSIGFTPDALGKAEASATTSP